MMRTMSRAERWSMSRLASSRSWLMVAGRYHPLRMAISLLQKIRLALRGWSRRREEKLQEFLQKESGRLGRDERPSRPVTADGRDDRRLPAGRPLSVIDLDGLHAAYLDQSGQIAYYLDVETGDVVE